MDKKARPAGRQVHMQAGWQVELDGVRQPRRNRLKHEGWTLSAGVILCRTTAWLIILTLKRSNIPGCPLTGVLLEAKILRRKLHLGWCAVSVSQALVPHS